MISIVCDTNEEKSAIENAIEYCKFFRVEENIDGWYVQLHQLDVNTIAPLLNCKVTLAPEPVEETTENEIAFYNAISLMSQETSQIFLSLLSKFKVFHYVSQHMAGLGEIKNAMRELCKDPINLFEEKYEWIDEFDESHDVELVDGRYVSLNTGEEVPEDQCKFVYIYWRSTDKMDKIAREYHNG